MPDVDLAFTSARSLLAGYASGALSPVEVVETLQNRISSIDGHLNSYVHLWPEEARRAAAEAEAAWGRGGSPRRLEGVPVAIKDVFAAGPTTAGSRLLADHVAAQESTVVRRLRDAGAIVLGKTATYEFAFGRPSLDGFQPPARNPWDRALDPGGSSSGSAVAVSAGLAYAGVGTDTSGSVRWPAAQSGVVGFKPTYGRVPRTGAIPLSWSMDHVGPIARTVSDAALMFEVMSGHDRGDPASLADEVPDTIRGLEDDVAGLRVGVPWQFFESSCDPEIAGVFQAAVAELENLRVEVLAVPWITLRQALAVTYPLVLAEAASYHAETMRDRLAEYSRDLRVFLPAGLLVDAHFYLRCQRVRQQLRHWQLAQLRELDAFALPTVGFLPHPIPQTPSGITFLSGEDFGNYTTVFNLTGVPAVSVPCGFTRQGLPVGMQLAGRPLDEPTVLRLARAYERATDWSQRRPPVENVT
jgi:aspartyl-tRNA(Asn)/glutamyl-tRNA(Gln) amidotransferase subunit A